MSTSDPSRLEPDNYFPGIITVGPGGNVTEIASADYIANGARGFRLYDSEAAASNPSWLVSEGGLDTNTVLTRNLILFTPALAIVAPSVGQLGFYDLGNNEQWAFRCVNVVQGNPTWTCTWSFIGGPWVQGRAAAGAAVGAGGSAAYPGAPQGPGIVPFFDGSYDVRVGALGFTSSALAFLGFTLGQGAPAGTHELAPFLTNGNAPYQEWMRERVTLTGGVSVEWWGRSPSSTPGTPVTATYQQRTIAIRPRTITTRPPAPV